jgi:hypothetical protein
MTTAFGRWLARAGSGHANATDIPAVRTSTSLRSTRRNREAGFVDTSASFLRLVGYHFRLFLSFELRVRLSFSFSTSSSRPITRSERFRILVLIC